MKILYVCQVDLSRQVGQTIHVREIVENWILLGHNVRLLAPGYAQRVNLNYVNYLPIFGNHFLRNIFFQLQLLLLLPFYIMFFRPQLIYTRYCSGMIMPAIWAFIFRVDHVTEINGDLLDELKILYRSPGWLLKIISTIEMWNYQLSIKIIAVTQGIKNILIERYHIPTERIFIIPNGVDDKKFYPISREKALIKTKLNPEFFYIGWTGVITEWQGLEHIIEIARCSHEKIKFVLVGNGPAKDHYWNIIQNSGLVSKFIFVGQVVYEEIPFWINSFDLCFIFKKLMRAGYSNLKFYEYLACGKPVLGNNVEGIGNIIQEFDLGMVIEENKIDVVVKKIETLCNDVKFKTQLSQHAIAYVQKYHTWQKNAENIIKIVNGLNR